MLAVLPSLIFFLSLLVNSNRKRSTVTMTGTAAPTSITALVPVESPEDGLPVLGLCGESGRLVALDEEVDSERSKSLV